MPGEGSGGLSQEGVWLCRHKWGHNPFDRSFATAWMSAIAFFEEVSEAELNDVFVC